MQLLLILTALTGASTINAAIALGQQFRNGQVNYNVAWVEGLNACSNSVAISLKGKERCGIPFIVDGNQYKLQYCGTNKFGVYHTNGKLYGRCLDVTQKKITCDGSVHDVIKWSVCA